MKKVLLLLSILYIFVFSILAQIPAGYYDSAIGKKQAELKTALHLKIMTAKVPKYGSGAGSTWEAFAKTDVRPEDRTVWDMYSNNHVAFNGNSAASGMNIEHSFAKSWWGDGRQAAQDVMHLAPSNSTANSAKGSWPMAVVDGTTSFSNGVIKVGKSSSRPGGEITAWEPADEYKGDFSRAYMYMVTAYEDYSTIWTGNSINQLDNNTYPVFEQWTVDLLLAWSRQDPVSQKEITRNNEVYKIQGNRNPYIDYPLMSEYVWGKMTTVAFTPDGNVDYPNISTPTNGTVVDFGKVVYQNSAHYTLSIKAQNLTGDLTFALSGANAANFSIPFTNLTKADAETGKELVINYTAQSIGAQTAQLTISGGGVTPCSILLKASSSDEFMALPALNISNSSFDANWTMSAGATGYILNVFTLQSSGGTLSKTLMDEEFRTSLGAWTKDGYADNTTLPNNVRIASGSTAGKIISPALDLSAAGGTLLVRAKQYGSDAGAQLTATMDNQALATWTTSDTNQDFKVLIPQGTTTSKISLAAAAGKRLYVDYVKIETQGAVISAVSNVTYPKSIGNVLSYTIDGLQSDSSYFYTVKPEGNSTAVSDPIKVRTKVKTGVTQNSTDMLSWSANSSGITLIHLPLGATLNVFDIVGKQVTAIELNASEYALQLPRKGIYLLQLKQKQKTQTVKIIY